MNRWAQFLSLVLALAVPAPTASGVKVGDAAPALILATADGQLTSLADRKGKVVLVDFWASWCGPCQAAFPAIDVLYRDLRDRGFDVLAVNVDESRDKAMAFLSDRVHALTVVFDPKGTSATAFGVSAMPSSFLIGRDGRVRFIHVGYTARTLDQVRREVEVLLAESAGTPAKEGA